MIDFSGYSREKIQKDMLSYVPRTIDTREGSVVQHAIGPVAWYLEGVYMLIQQMEDSVYADTASGESLDRVCAVHDITRKGATRAVREGTFDVEVPAGSVFKTVNGSDSAVFLSGGPLSGAGGAYTYELTCAVPGEAGNAYSGNIVPVTAVSGMASAVIGAIITPGTDEEGDGALRERLLQKVRCPSTSGNIYDYYNWAMECEGVGAAKVFPLADGPGTVKVAIADANASAATAELLKTVQDHIEKLRPIGADVTVASAIERVINVSARVRLTNGVNLGTAQNAFKTALVEYLRGNAFDLSYVSLAHIGSLLLGIAGIADYEQLQLNGVEDNVKLEQVEIAVTGAVTLEVMV